MSQTINSTVRPVAKPKSRKKAEAPTRVKTAVVISTESFQRLRACSIKENMDQSEIIELLIGKWLSSYSVSVREGRGIHDLLGRQSGVSPAVIEDRLDADDRVSRKADAAA